MKWHDHEPETILRVLVGSTAHGLHVADAREDRDEMGIAIEPLEYVLGLGGSIDNPRTGTQLKDHYLFRTAAVREGRGDAPSQAGDLDLMIYGLRKYVLLALAGNPTVLIALFVEPLFATREGIELRELAPFFASQQAGQKFLGYMRKQRERLLGERGQKRCKRQDLVDKYGFDTKYAGHVIRLGLQGVEYMQTGQLTLPMQNHHRTYVRQIRTGHIDFKEIIEMARSLEADLEKLLTTSPLPKFPDTRKVEDWMCEVYMNRWLGRI